RGLRDDVDEQVELLGRDAYAFHSATRDVVRGLGYEAGQLFTRLGRRVGVHRARVDELVPHEVDVATLEPSGFLLELGKLGRLVFHVGPQVVDLGLQRL